MIRSFKVWGVAAIVTIAGTAGCTGGLDVPVQRTSSIVVQYRDHGRFPIYDGQRWVVVTRENAPTLVVHPGETWACKPHDANGECPDDLSAPVGLVDVNVRRLTFPDGRSIDESEVDDAEIRISGDAYVPPDPVRPRPKSSDVEPVDRSERRHQLGAQLGGTAYLQLSYRYHFGSGIFLDTGYLPTRGAHNGSVGLLAGLFPEGTWMPYAGLGGGFGHVMGPAGQDCDPTVTMCESKLSTYASTFVYGRLGLALHFGAGRRHGVGIDGGLWYGLLHRSDGRERRDTVPFLWPMAGLSYHGTL